MRDISTIRLGIGLGNLHFGASRSEAEAYLGTPDRINEDDDNEGVKHFMWLYDSFDGYVSFDENNDFRMGGIETSSPSATLHGLSLIDRTRTDVVDLLEPVALGTPEIEVSDLKAEGDGRIVLVNYDDKGLFLWFEDDALEAISWSVLFDENDNILWPVRSSEQPASGNPDKPGA